VCVFVCVSNVTIILLSKHFPFNFFTSPGSLVDLCVKLTKLFRSSQSF